jgi:hypothetical protein
MPARGSFETSIAMRKTIDALAVERGAKRGARSFQFS